jgi:phosphohistidine swiveling domain-containing protein
MLPSKEHYIKAVRRPYPVLPASIIGLAWAEEKYYARVLDKPYCMRDIINTDYVWYFSKADIEKGGELSLESWRNPEKLKQTQEEFKKRENNLLESTQKDLPTFVQATGEYVPPLILVYAIDKPLEKEIRKLLSEKLSQEETDELMDKLNSPIQNNSYKQEEYDLITANDLQAHVKKYEWLNSRYGSRNPYTIEQAQEKLSQINKEEYLKKYKEEKIKLRQTISKAKEILEENAHLIDLLQYIIYYRTQRTDILNKGFYFFIPLAEKLAESLNLTYDQFMNCTIEEIQENKIPSFDLISQRQKDFSYIMENKIRKCLVGEECNKIREFVKEDLSNITELKGNIACKGLIKGKARIIMDSEDFNKFNDGDIIVTAMTTPEFVPIMKKASAFITDEGGITCHAAIISREMNKPCIIGTTNATNILKDGDLVEVDAEKGIVKILEKK